METLDVRATMIGAAPAPPAGQPEELAKAHERLRTIVAISNAVQTELDLDKLLNEIMASLFRIFPQADRGFIMLKPDEGEDLEARVERLDREMSGEEMAADWGGLQKMSRDRSRLKRRIEQRFTEWEAIEAQMADAEG